MSYDLWFRFRSETQRAALGELLAYFEGRPNYERSNNQAWYSNKTTGVYFSFEQIGSEEDAVLSETVPIAFNLNYYRPHVFGLEAEPELTSFVRKFDLLVSDPQISGMGDGEYSPEGFLSGWNTGNELAYRAVTARSEEKPPHLLPSDLVERIWRWNVTRDARAHARGDDVYVPRVFYFEVGSALRTGVIWADAMPVLLPEVDVVLAPREELAPRRWLRRIEDQVLFEWFDFRELAEGFSLVEGPLPARELSYSRPPATVEDFLRSRTPIETDRFKVIPSDQVLDLELYRRAESSGTRS